MKIIESQSATLTNAEVLSHLTTLPTRRRPPNARTRPPVLKDAEFEAVSKELTNYLTASRSPLPPYREPHYSGARMRTLFQRLAPYNLTKAEMMMIVNLRPHNAILLDCVVEECDERFSEEAQIRILGIVEEVLGRREEAGNAMEGVQGIGG